MSGDTRDSTPVGVVLLNLGAPEGDGDVRDFIRRLLSDPDVMPVPWPVRPLLARSIARRRAGFVAQHYREIGGRSPLSTGTRDQVEALRRELGERVVVRYAFRHSPPFAADVLAGMAAAGVRRVIALPAYPQFTRSTTGSALRDVARAARKAGVELRDVPSFPDAPGYIESMASRMLPLVDGGTRVVFSAHGLPMSTIRGGDPYLDEVERTVTALRRLLPAGVVASLAFQSRVGRMEWTGPNVVAEVERLAAEGVRRLVVVPISFVCENLETVHELDIELAEHARSLGIESFARVPTPGCHPAFVRDLADRVRAVADAAGWELER